MIATTAGDSRGKNEMDVQKIIKKNIIFSFDQRIFIECKL